MTQFRRFPTGLLATFLFAACSGGGDAEPGSAAESFRVALLTPGPISDKSWNAGAYAGLIAIRDSLGASVSHIQTRTPAEFDENFRQYGAKGFNLVFGHGFEFQDAALRVAPNYPNTVYITTSGTSVAPNVGGAEFAFEESSYLAGMVAGTMTTSNVIGIIGGTELPPVKRSFAAFQQGARKTNPQARFLLSYIGNWDDVSAGKEQAIAQISRGADVIFQNADAAGLGVFQAVKEARGVLAIGSNSNQNDIVSESTIGSVVIDLPKAFLLIAREVQAGGFSGRVFRLGLENDVVTFVPNPALVSRIPTAVMASVDSAARQMMEGTFTGLLPDSMRKDSSQ